MNTGSYDSDSSNINIKRGAHQFGQMACSLAILVLPAMPAAGSSMNLDNIGTKSNGCCSTYVDNDNNAANNSNINQQQLQISG